MSGVTGAASRVDSRRLARITPWGGRATRVPVVALVAFGLGVGSASLRRARVGSRQFETSS